ncbi:hypothetical protein D3C71_1233260 [compost metagenome]
MFCARPGCLPANQPNTAFETHRQGQPWAADRLPGFLANNEDIGLGMIDLHDFQGTGRAERSGNCRCRLHDLLFTAAPGALLEVDVLEASDDHSAMRPPTVQLLRPSHR